MSLLLKFLGGTVGPYMFLGVLMVLLLSLTVNGCQYQEVERYKQTSADLTAQTNGLIDNSHTQEAVITKQTDELTAWKATADKSALDMKNALVAANLAQTALTTYQQQLHKLEDKDRGNPTCDAFLAMDVATACPNITSSLRQRAAAGDLPGQSGRSPNPGGHAP